jgi:hypothetical protein
MNNRTYSLVFFCLSTIFCFGQNLVYNPGTSVSHTMEGKVNELSITVTTPTPEAITYAWKKISNTFPADWDYSLCDHTNCYIGMPNSGEMWAISLSEAEAGQKGFFKLNVLDATTQGTYEIQIYVYDSKDINRGDTLTFKATNGVSLVESAVASKVKLSPNPANAKVDLQLESANTSIEVYSMSGELVKQVTSVANGNYTLDVTDLANGLYSVQLKSQEGIKQSRLVIQH